MEPIISPPNLLFGQNATPLPITAFEKEVFLTTTTGQAVKYTIRAYPNQRTETQLDHPPLHGKVEFHTDRTFSYQPHSSFKGIDTFSCLLQNGLGQVIVIPFTIIVNTADPKKKELEMEKNVTANIKPFVPIPQFSTTLGKKLVKDIPLYEDTEEPYTVSLRKQSLHGRVRVYADGTFEYTPSVDFVGKDSFQVSQHFTDGDTENITIEVLVVKPIIKKPNQITSKSKSKGRVARKKR